MNGYINDGAHEALDDRAPPDRGVATQSVFVAFLFLATNLRKIETFLKNEEAVAEGQVSLGTRDVRPW